MRKVYIHKKTGKRYELISDNFMFKDNSYGLAGASDFSGRMCVAIDENQFTWRGGLILYKALYDCPEGPFFARLPKDFFSNFEEEL